MELTENAVDKISYDHLRADIDFVVDRPFFFIVEVDHIVLAMGKIRDPNWSVCLYVFPVTYYIDFLQL